MIKKYLAVLLALAVLLPASVFPLSAAAQEGENQLLIAYDFGEDYSPSASYSDAPTEWNGVSWKASDYPFFKGTAENAIRYTTLEDTTQFTAPGAGQPYPCKSPTAPAYPRLNLGGSPFSLSSTFVNENAIGYQMTIRFSSGTAEMPAGFAETCFMLRYGASSWVSGVTNDFRLWTVSDSGVLKVGSYEQQLELDTEYSLFFLADQRGDTNSLSLYMNGELVAENEAMGLAGADATEEQKKFIASSAYVVYPREKGSDGQYVWKDVDFYAGDAKIYTVADINQVTITGDDVIYVGTSLVSAQYEASKILGLDGISWSVAPETQGLSIDQSGLLTVEPGVENGEYTIAVSGQDGTVLQEKTIRIEGLSYQLVGNSSLLMVPDAGNQKFEYQVRDSRGEAVDAEFSFAQDYPGLRLDGGTIKTDGSFTGSSIVLNATYQGETFTKTISVSQGKLYDFEDGSTTGWGQGSGAIANPIVTDETTGNTYFDPQGTRWNSPSFIANPITDGTYTVEFDFLANENSSAISFSVAKREKPDGSIDTGAWWADIYVRKDYIEDNVQYYVMTYNGNTAGKFPEGWNHAKISLNFSDKITRITINGTTTEIPTGSFTSGSGDYDLTLSSIICRLALDNLRVYSGQALEQKIESLDIPDKALIPGEGQKKTIDLKAVVLEDGEYSDTTPVEWSLTEECSFASISGNVLTYDEKANGSITVKAVIKGTQQEATKTIEFAHPDVSFTVKDSGLELTGPADKEVIIKIYGPKDTTDTVSSFIEAWSMDDEGAQAVAEATVTLDAQGKGSYTMDQLTPGRYRVYTALEDSDLYYDAEVDIEFDTLFTDAEKTMDSTDFPALLQIHTDRTWEECTNAWEIYSALEEKENVAQLLEKDLKNFFAAVALENVLEQTTYQQTVIDVAKTELTALSIDTAGLDLLQKNGKYTEAVDAVSNFAGLKAACEDLWEKAILKGIENVANKRDAKTFLAEIGNSKYDGATSTQKDTIAEAVAGNSYSSISALESAVNAVQLSSGSGGSGGGSGTSGGGSTGGNKFVTGGNTSQNSGRVTMSGELDEGSIPASDSAFRDVTTGHWAYPVITYMAEQKIINGDGGNFRPEDTITRAEFVKILVEAFQVTGEGSVDFSDVSAENWVYPYLERACANGLVLGDGGLFRPDENITREDAALMALRFARYSGMEIPESEEPSFTDADQISPYASEAVASLSEAELIRGMEDGSFAPKKAITRAEAVQMVYNILTGGIA